MKLYNFKGQQNSITDALRLKLPEHAVISLVGAGGKTSLMFAWARELSDAGKKVIVTTTTHMMHPAHAEDVYEGKSMVYSSDYEPDADALIKDFRQMDELLAKGGVLMIASEDPDNRHKVIAPPDEILKYACKCVDVILIEADGSRRMPIKWPADWEPAVPDNTDVSVCVAGLSALGRKTNEVMYRAEDLPELLRRETVDEALIAFLVSSPDAGLKGTYGDYRVYLNQADNEEMQQKAADIQRLLAVRGIQCAWGSLL